MRFVLLPCLVFLWSLPAVAQSVVVGRVVDEASGQALPAATVQVEGTYRGTITNADGVFELPVEAWPVKLVVRYIGYETARREVTGPRQGRLRIALAPATYELPELVVSDEDPAVGIMRRVIARKQEWREALASYRADVYNRFTISNDTGIVSILETMTEVFWEKERGAKEVLKARRTTSNLDLQEALPAAFFVANLYDDDIEVGGHTLRGVTHPKALRHYVFRLKGTRQVDDRLVYDISVRPKSRLDSGFEGRVAVLDSAYALLEVALRPSEAFRFPPPIDRYAVTYEQQYSSYGGAFWLPVDFRARMALELSFSGLLAFPQIDIEQVSRFADYAVNEPPPDSLYRDERYLKVDSLALAQDTLLERAGAAVPLTVKERTAYVSIDSTDTLEEAFRPTGPLARFVNARVSDGERPPRRGDASGSWDADVEPLLWYDRVDALHVGGKALLDAGERVSLSAGAGYSSGLSGADRWSYRGTARLQLGPDEAVSVEAEYFAGTALRYTSSLYDRAINSLYTLFGGADYFDYYRRRGLAATVGYAVDRLDMTVSATLRDERNTSLPRTTSYDLFGDAVPLRPNPPVSEGRLRSVGLRIDGGDAFNPLMIFGQRRVVVEAEYSDPDVLGGAFSFARVGVDALWRFETFFRRRFLPNVLDVRITAGASSGTLPPQRAFAVDGAMGLYTPFGGLRTLDGRPYTGDRALGVFWEHNFRTVPFEAVGLDALARRSYNLIVFGSHGQTWSVGTSDPGAEANQLPEHMHHEVGISLSGLFAILRVDVAKRLDASGWNVGLSAARMF